MLDILVVSSFWSLQTRQQKPFMCTSPTVLVPSPWLTSGIRISVRSACTTHNFTIHRVWGCGAVGVRPVSRGHLLITSCPVAHKPSIFRGGWNSPPMFLWTQETVRTCLAVCGGASCWYCRESSLSVCQPDLELPSSASSRTCSLYNFIKVLIDISGRAQASEVGPQMAPEQLVGCSSGDVWHSWSGWGHSHDLHVGQSLSKHGS